MIGTYEILTGDCREVLATLPEQHFHCCVTSPPYFGLRDYGVDGQLGLEPTPAEFVAAMVEVFRGVWRVLRDDGVCWVNLGDSYAGSGKGSNPDGTPHPATLTGKQGTNKGAQHGIIMPQKAHEIGLKPKDLMGMPWRVAFALQADGWYLRDAVVWWKPSPMPGSQRDRCTSSYEFVFQLTKKPRYYFDMEAVKEESRFTKVWRGEQFKCGDITRHHGAVPHDVTPGGTRTPRNVWTIASEGFSGGVSYGSYRITSPDCPVHGCLSCLAHALECDGLQGDNLNERNLGIDDRPDQVPEGAVVSIPSDQCEFHVGSPAAISRSILLHKMAVELGRDETCGDKSDFHIACKRLANRSCATSGHIHGCNTWADYVSGAMGIDPSAQTGDHILGICTFERAPECSCQYIGKVEKRQDHFAVFPTALPEKCIKASTSEKGCCPACGMPWVRVVETTPLTRERPNEYVKRTGEDGTGNSCANTVAGVAATTIGWQPGCECKADHDCAGSFGEWQPRPCRVLDIFGGAGTTAIAACRLGRDCTLIELNEEYIEMARNRIDKALRPSTARTDSTNNAPLWETP